MRAAVVAEGAAGTSRASMARRLRVTVHRSHALIAFATALLVVTAGAGRVYASDTAVQRVISDILSREDPLVLDGISVNGPSLRSLYTPGNGSALWHDKADAVTAVMADAATEGLDASAYDLNTIATRRADKSDEGKATLDLLVSDAMLRYTRDVRYGHSRPRVTAEAAFGPAPDVVPVVQWVAESPDAAEAMRALPPQHREYTALRTALAAYRKQLDAGMRWPTVPDGPTIRPGNSDPAVPALRARLAATGEYTGDTQTKSHRFDPELVAAVKAFQATHGLKDDGSVGPMVRAALNVGPATRVEQLVTNMERWRWMPDDLGTRRVVVNIPAQRVRFVDGDATIFEGPVIVGETDKETPTFSSAITQVIFNPSWTVPPKIARKELLPKAERDNGYFARQGIQLIGTWQPNADGEGGTRGVTLRQAPGPKNPLGRVKFLLPNVFGVYLHDTSNRNLFTREKRTLSHGCVRVGGALDFADDVLADHPHWSEERKERILSGWKTTTIGLEKPIPVHLMYQTAWVDADGRAHFIDDVYGRDRRLADQLAGRRTVPVAPPVRVAEP